MAELPPRVAHVLHALMEAWINAPEGGPLSAAQVRIYDREARSVRQTATALEEAHRKALAGHIRGLWYAADRAWTMQRALKDRYLAEVD